MDMAKKNQVFFADMVLKEEERCKNSYMFHIPRDSNIVVVVF